MEFQGRIIGVLPAKTGTRQDGTAFTELKFIFAYYEAVDSRYEDSIVLSTIDERILAKIAPFVVRGEDRKAVEQGGMLVMTVPYVTCRCGWGMRAKMYQRRDGSGTAVFQDNKCYKLEIDAAAGSGNAIGTAQPFPPKVDNQGMPAQAAAAAPAPLPSDADDLPF